MLISDMGPIGVIDQPLFFLWDRKSRETAIRRKRPVKGNSSLRHILSFPVPEISTANTEPNAIATKRLIERHVIKVFQIGGHIGIVRLFFIFVNLYI